MCGRNHQVDRDPAARDALIELSRHAGAWPPGGPTFVLGSRLVVGFDDAEHLGAEVLRLLDERGRRRLKLLSGAVMLTLGLVMLLRPQWLM